MKKRSIITTIMAICMLAGVFSVAVPVSAAPSFSASFDDGWESTFGSFTQDGPFTGGSYTSGSSSITRDDSAAKFYAKTNFSSASSEGYSYRRLKSPLVSPRLGSESGATLDFCLKFDKMTPITDIDNYKAGQTGFIIDVNMAELDREFYISLSLVQLNGVYHVMIASYTGDRHNINNSSPQKMYIRDELMPKADSSRTPDVNSYNQYTFLYNRLMNNIKVYVNWKYVAIFDGPTTRTDVDSDFVYCSLVNRNINASGTTAETTARLDHLCIYDSPIPPSHIETVNEYVWPTMGTGVSSLYTWNGSSGHKGIDIIPAEWGTSERIYNFADGYVVKSIYQFSYGYMQIINHNNPKPSVSDYVQTRYAHLQTFADGYNAGNNGYIPILGGWVLGMMGTSGASSAGVHLHFEVRTIADMYNRDVVTTTGYISPFTYFTKSGGIAAAMVSLNGQTGTLTEAQAEMIFLGNKLDTMTAEQSEQMKHVAFDMQATELTEEQKAMVDFGLRLDTLTEEDTVIAFGDQQVVITKEQVALLKAYIVDPELSISEGKVEIDFAFDFSEDAPRGNH